MCTCWAVKYQSCYILYLPELTIVMPCVEENICVQSRELPPRLQARLVELLQYRCKFEAGVRAWNVMQELKELETPSPEPPDKQVTCKIWEHTCDITQRRHNPGHWKQMTRACICSLMEDATPSASKVVVGTCFSQMKGIA